MSEWWTYSLHSFLLFSPRVYWRLIEQYNQALWPVQIAILLVGAAAFFGVLRRWPRAWRAVWVLLAGGWLFVTWAYLLQRYAAINWPVRYLAPFIFLEGILLLGLAFRTQEAVPAGRGTGRFLLFYGLAGHPLVTAMQGGAWSAAELVGLLPDPTAIVTLGVLLTWGRGGLSRALLVIPLLWCLFSFFTLLAMGAPVAWVMLAVSGLAVLAGWNGRGGGRAGGPSP